MEEISKNGLVENSKPFIDLYENGIYPLRKIVECSARLGIYTPVFGSSLAWLDGMKMADNNGVLVQAMRDFFGRHGIVTKDGKEMSIDWSSET
jgi:6-phosphogluconate dehydrogenase